MIVGIIIITIIAVFFGRAFPSRCLMRFRAVGGEAASERRWEDIARTAVCLRKRQEVLAVRV